MLRKDSKIHLCYRRIQSRSDSFLCSTSGRRVRTVFIAFLSWITTPLPTFRGYRRSSFIFQRNKINGSVCSHVSISASISHLFLSLLVDSWGWMLRPPSNGLWFSSRPIGSNIDCRCVDMSIFGLPSKRFGKLTSVYVAHGSPWVGSERRGFNVRMAQF